MAEKQSATVSVNETDRPPSGTQSPGDHLASPNKSDHPSREQLVREAAYRRFETRGGEHGRHEEDWMEAEKEVRPPEGN